MQTSLHFAIQFRNLKVISKLGGHFAAILKLGDHFAAKWEFRRGGGFSQPISQLRNGGTGAVKWHSCAKWWFRSCKTPFQMASRLRNFRSALRARLQMAITSLFHLQIAYHLKHWTPDFPSFETRYGMHNLSSIKCFKNVSNSSKMEVRHFR